MRIVHFEHGGRQLFGSRTPEGLRTFQGPASVSWDVLARALASREPLPVTGPVIPDGEARVLPPVPRPGKIVCIGLNYADHAREGGHPLPTYPAVFLRTATSITGHGQPLVCPPVSQQFDYEAELALVVGRRAHRVRAGDALSCVAGYTCFNDGSLRDYQRKSGQWTMGKNFDRSGALGPDLVTPDELPEGVGDLRITARLNGRTLQDGRTRDMIFSVPELIEIVSEVMTLEPGDVIATGTPAGVGFARTPPVFMAPGDVCEIEIEGIGVLRNVVASEEAAAPRQLKSKEAMQ